MTKTEKRAERVHWTKARSDNAGPEPRELDGLMQARREILKREVAMLMQADSRRKTGLQKLGSALDSLDGIAARFGELKSFSGRPLNQDIKDLKHRLDIVKVVFTAADSGLMQAQAVLRQRRRLEDGVWDPNREVMNAEEAAVLALEQEQEELGASIEQQRVTMHEELKAITSRVEMALDLDLVLTSDLQGEMQLYRESHHRAYGDFVTLHARLTENTSDFEQWQGRLNRVLQDAEDGIEPLVVHSTGFPATDEKEGYTLDEFVDQSQTDVTSLMQATTATRKRMQALLHMLRRQGINTTEKVTMLENTVHALHAQLEDRQAELEHNMAVAQEEKEDLHRLMDQEKAELRISLEAKMAHTIVALDRKEKECHTLKERMLEKDEHLARHAKETKLAEQKMAKQKRTIADLEEKLDERERNISRLNMQIVSLEQQLKTMFSKHRMEMEGLSKKLTQAREQKDELRRMVEQGALSGGPANAEPQTGVKSAPQGVPAPADNRILIAAEMKIADLQSQIIESLAEKNVLKEQIASLEKSVTTLIKKTSETLKNAGMQEKYDQLEKTVQSDQGGSDAAVEAEEAASSRDDAYKSVKATADEMHARKMAHELAMATLQREMSEKQRKGEAELENEWQEVRKTKSKLEDIEKELQARAKASHLAMETTGAPALEKTSSTRKLEDEQSELRAELMKARMRFREQLKEDRKKMEEELKNMKKRATEDEAALKQKLDERQKLLEKAQKRADSAEAALKQAAKSEKKDFREMPRPPTTSDRIAQMVERVTVAQDAAGELHQHLEQKHEEKAAEQEKTMRKHKAAFNVKMAVAAFQAAASESATPPPQAPKSTTPSKQPSFIRSPQSTPRPTSALPTRQPSTIIPRQPSTLMPRQGSKIIAAPIPTTTPRKLGHATTLPSPSAPSVGRVPEHPSEGPPALWLPAHAAAYGGQHRSKTAALPKAPAFSPRGPSGAKNMNPVDVADLQTARGERPSTARARMEGAGTQGSDSSRPMSAATPSAATPHSTPHSAATPRPPQSPESFPEPAGDTHFSSPWHTSSRLTNTHTRKRRPAARHIWNTPGGEVLEGWMSSDDERYDFYNAPHQPQGGKHAGKAQRPMSAAVHGAVSRRPQSAVQRRPVSARVPETKVSAHLAAEASEAPPNPGAQARDSPAFITPWSPAPPTPTPSRRTPRAATSTPDSRFATPSPSQPASGARGRAQPVDVGAVGHPSIVTFVASPGHLGATQSPGSGMRGTRVPKRRPASGSKAAPATRVSLSMGNKLSAWQAGEGEGGGSQGAMTLGAAQPPSSEIAASEGGPAPSGIPSLPLMPDVT